MIVSGAAPAVLNISSVTDDGSGFLYLSSGKALHVHQHLTTCTILYNASSLVLAGDKSTVLNIDRSVTVFGYLTIQGNPLVSFGKNGEKFTVYSLSNSNELFISGLTLETSGQLRLYNTAAQTSVCLWKLKGIAGSQFRFMARSSFHVYCPVILHGSVLSIEEGSELFVYGNTRSVVSMEHAIVKGSLNVSILDFGGSKWKSLTVHPQATFAFYPHDRVMNISSAISIAGAVSVRRPLLIYTTDFTVSQTGRLEWNRNETASLEAENVIINSKLNAGPLMTGKGWKSLTIGPDGEFSFLPVSGELRIDKLIVEGKLFIEGPVTLRGFSTDTTQLISIAEGASFEIKQSAEFAPSASEVTNVSTVMAERVIVNGMWSLKQLRIFQGWKSLSVGRNGTFSFIASGDFPIGMVAVEGQLLIGNSVVLKGKDSPLISSFTVGYSARVEFDMFGHTLNDILSTNNTSKVLANVVDVKGTWQAKKLNIEPGWDSLTIGVSGLMQFLPTGELKMNTLTVNGKLLIEGTVKFRGRNSTAIKTVTVGTLAKMMFDLPPSRPHNRDKQLSEMVADAVNIGGTWMANKLRIEPGWKTLTIATGARLGVLPVGDFAIGDIFVYGQLLVNSTITLRGSSSRSSKFEIGASGRVEFNLPATLPHTPRNVSETTSYSVTVRGTWIAHKLANVQGWNSLLVDNGGLVSLLPIGRFSVGSVTVNGQFLVQSTISLRGNGNFVIGPQARVEFGLKPLTLHTSSQNVSEVASYRSVIVQGVWQARKLAVEPGWDSLTVGNAGLLQFLPKSDFRMNTLTVSGSLLIEGAIKFRGRNSAAIKTVYVGSGAKMRFDLAVPGPHNQEELVSEMVAEAVNVEGAWIANKLRIEPGWKTLTIATGARLVVLPVGDFAIGDIFVYGQLLVNSTITLRGNSSRSSKFQIGASARVEFNLPATLPHTPRNVSETTSYSVTVRGTWIAHKMANMQGWNSLLVDRGGLVSLLPIGRFSVGSVTVNGQFLVQSTISLRGNGDFVIGPQAQVEFGLKPLTLHTSSQNVSKVASYRSVIVQGTWQTKKLAISPGWRSLLIDTGALLRVLPVGVFAVGEVTVKGQLLVESTITLRGSNNFVVAQNARVEFDIAPSVPHTPLESFSEVSSYTSVTVEGSWLAQKLSIAPGWTGLYIGTRGLLRLLPVRRFNIDRITVKGELLVERTIQIEGKRGIKTNPFAIELGGRVEFDLHPSRPHSSFSNVSEVRAQDVTVNGHWTANKMKIKSGWRSLTVGAGAVMRVLPVEDYNITNVVVNGQLLVNSTIALYGSTTYDNSKFLIGRSARVEFDLPAFLSHKPTKDYSETSSYSVTVQGTWIARKLSIARGWQQLMVDTNGFLRLLPIDTYQIDSVSVKGQLLVESNIELRGKRSALTSSLTVWSGAKVTFYLPPTRPHTPKSDVSKIQASAVTVNGLWSANKLKIKPGWQSFSIGQGAQMTMIPIEEYNVASVTVNGKLLVSSTIVLRGGTSDDNSRFTIGPSARVEYDLPTVLQHTPAQNFSETSSYAVTVQGTWIARKMAIAPGWKRLLVETGGVLMCLPIGAFNIDTVTVKGQFLVESILHLLGKTSSVTRSFVVASGAKVTFDLPATRPHFPLSDASEVNADDVTVNGIWTANKMKIQPGWKSLTIGSGAQMMLLPIGEYMIERITVSGQLMVNSTITLRGSTTDANSYIRINQGARVEFDLQTSLSHSPARSFSEASSYTVTVDGTWIARKLAIAPGWKSLVVGSKGLLKLLPVGEYAVDTVTINGQFQVEKNIFLRGKQQTFVQSFVVGYSATVEFDLPATRAHVSQNDTSEVLANVVTLQDNARWVARKMAIGIGWQTLTINSGATFSVLPIRDYGIDTIAVNSNAEFLIESTIVIHGRTSALTGSVTIGSRAVVKFDLPPSRTPYVPPQSFSEIRAHVVSIDGTLLAQKLKIKPGWQRLFIGQAGVARVLPVEDYPIDTVTVNGQFQVECNITLHGKTSMFVSSVTLGTRARVEFDLPPSRPNAKQNNTSEVKANFVELQTSSVWVARKLRIGLGWVKLTVGVGAEFSVLPIGEYPIDDTLVNGQLSIESTIIMQGRSKALMSSFVVSQGATAAFDLPQTRPNTRLQSLSELKAVTVTVNGVWRPQKLKIRPGWSSLSIGPRGIVRVLPVDIYQIDSVTVNGQLEVESTISLRGKSSNFVGNILLGPSSTVKFDLSASRPNVQVNDTSNVFANKVSLKTKAQWTARKMSIGLGWLRLIVDPLAVFSLIAIDEYPIDYVTVNGKFLVESPIVINGRSSPLTKSLVIGNSGNMEFDIQPPSRPNTPSHDFSQVQAEDVVDNGRWTAQKLKIKPGWKSLSVGSRAFFRFLPIDIFNINQITVQGQTLVEGTIFLRGKDSTFVTSIYIEAGGEVLFDQPNSRPYTRVNDTSEVLADTVTVNGNFITQRMSIGNFGWKVVSVGQSGRFEFFPISTYRIDRITVDGRLTALTGFVLKGRSKRRTEYIRVNSKGTLTVQTKVLTTIYCSRYFVSGTSNIGNLTAPPKWDDLTVSGKFYFASSLPLDIDVLYVTGTGLVQTVEPIPPKGRIWGKSLTIDNGGKLHINYQGTPVAPHYGTINSTVYMTRVVVNGRLEAGSLYVVSDDLTVGSTGVIDVSNGGALGGSGPGTGSNSGSGASGASHGGRGGRGAGTLADNLPYGNILRPGGWGSGGGHGVGNVGGGRGGGRIEMNIRQTLEVQGLMQMDGQPAQVSTLMIL